MADAGGKTNLRKHYRETSFFGVVQVLKNLRTIRRQMEEQFGASGRTQGDYRQARDPYADRTRGREGGVRVQRTSGEPEKRVSKDVGDYIDFEEEKN